METIASVQKKIEELDGARGDNEKSIQAAEERIRNARQQLSELEGEINTFKAERQTALVEGDNSRAGGMSKRIKELEGDQELKSEEVSGLNSKLVKLGMENKVLSVQIAALKVRIPQLRSLLLAKEYNKLAELLASVVCELNDLNLDLERDKSNNCRVVFGLLEGALDRIPKLYFDDDGPKLEEFVARHPGVYPTNIQVSERCFYDFNAHRNEVVRLRSA
jgi:chromosome segregation ATPase